MTIDLSSDSPTTSISVSEGASQTNFTVSFKFNNAADLNVFVDGTQKADNTISLSSGGSGSTGVISISGGVTGATGGSTVVITRDTVHSRTTDFPSAGAFSISKLNTELDALIFMNADKKFSAQRALTLSEFDDTSISTNIPVKADRLDKVLAFNSSTGVPEARDYLTAANATALASITAGTVAASKYVLVDANKDIGTFRNITLTGELDAGSLDISGDADIDGTLEADAITIGGVTLAETISDTVGAMVSSNTETGISVSYEDSDNTLDFVLGSSQTTISSLLNTSLVIGRDSDNDIDFATDNTIIFRASGADQIKLVDGVLSPVTDADIDLGSSSLQFKDGFFHGTLEADAITINGTTLAETISDTVGAMVSSNTETGISVTYEDSDNTLDFVIGSGSIASSMIAADAITGAKIADDAINSEHYTDGSIDTAHIADDQVTQAKIADDAVGADQLASNAVVTASITDANVTTDKIADDAVTLAKMAGLARGKIIVGDSSGNPTALALGSNGEFLKSDGSDLVFGAATISGLAADDLTAGDAAVNLTTTTGNITIDAQAGDSDIIFKGTDGSSDTTFLTLDGSDAGTAIFNNDVQLKSDSSVLSFGADNEITLTHNPDKGLILKNANTADDKPVKLALHTGETDLAADDVLGVIEFQAPDEGTGSDANLLAAAIRARSEGDFSSGSNATALDFMTGSSEAATKRMQLSSIGSLSVASNTTAFATSHVIEGRGTSSTGIALQMQNDENSASGQLFVAGSSYNAFGVSAKDVWIYSPEGTAIGSNNDKLVKLVSHGGARLVVSGEHVGVGTSAPANSGLFGGTQVSLNVMGSLAPEVRIKSSTGDCDTSLIASNSSSNFFIINGANGVALSHDGTSFGSASDERKKDIIENITDAEEKINKLRAVIGKYKITKTYEADVLYTQEEKEANEIPDGKDVGDIKIAKGTKKDGDKEGVRRSFLLAQDFLNNFPEPVSEVPEMDNDGNETSDTYYQLEYQGVIPLLVAGIKELSAKCADYEKRIKALESG